MENMQNNHVQPQTQQQPPQVPQPPQAFAMPYSYTGVYGKPTQPKPKKTVDLERIDYVFFGIFAVLTLCLVFFGLFGGMAIGFTFSAIAMIVSLAIYMLKNGDFTFVSVSSLVLAIASSLVFALYTDDHLSRFIAFAILLTSNALCAISIVDDTVADTVDGLIKLVCSVLISPLENLLVPIRALFKNDKNKTALQIGGALLASIPVLIVVISLLVSADAAFEGLIGKLIESLGMTILKLVISVVIFAILLSFAVSCKFELNETNSYPINFEKSRTLKSPFAVTFLGMIALVYLIYMFSQTAYFFSAFSGILPEGYTFTFAQYARRGFFETEAIAFINLMLMGFVLWRSKRREGGELNPILKGIMTFISVFTILFIITALSKMVMYINEYGLTVLRLFTSVFMLATSVVIIAFIIRIFNSELETMKYAAIISMALFTVLCICGIDRTVASYNVNAYLNGTLEKVDVETLYYLSDSAIPYLAKLTDCENESVREEAEQRITDHYFYADYENWICESEKDNVIKIDFKYGADFTLSKYLTAKAINSRNIEPNYEEYEEHNSTEPIGNDFTADTVVYNEYRYE